VPDFGRENYPVKWLCVLAVAAVSAWAADNDWITVLYDSHAVKPLSGGWGYSAVLYYRGANILFDAGGSPAELAANAKALAIDLSKLDAAVVSHDDYDHYTGLSVAGTKIPVYVPDSDSGAFATSMTNRVMRFVQGLIPGQHLVDAPEGLRYIPVAGLGTQIRPGARLAVFPFGDGRREQVLLLDTPGGTVMMTGCAHPGIAMMAKQTKARGIVGGMHLQDTPLDKIRNTVLQLKSAGVVWASPGHCTGPKATEELRRQLGPGVSAVGVGGRVLLGPDRR
jgi:7,8-dihydropterin-6-yl-methyl-4-(beta-D-ribofuranosyl)aminobenzene 5'-phosphate synthase